MRQTWITRVGPPEVLQVKEAPDPSAGPGEVRIRVRAAGINFADIMARLGLYPDAPKLPAVVGYEVSGTVDEVGSGVRSVKAGDPVIALCRFGGYSDTVVAPEDQVFPMPQGMGFEEGAAIGVNYLTVYQMLFAMGSIKAGEKVLVLSAAGGVGFAAVDLCHIAGAEVIGAASAGKHDALRKRGVTKLIDYRTQDVETEVKRLTGGKGVHIVLDPAGGASWAKSFRCLAKTGRLVVFGFSAAAAGKKRSLVTAARRMMEVPWLKLNPINLMNENKAVIGVNLGHMWSEQAMLKSWAAKLLDWYREGKIHPTVDRAFPLERAAEAHHYMQDRKNIGKIVLTP